jgi:SAM-dependent methyltransferase
VEHVKAPSSIDRVRAALRRTAFEALYGPFAWAYDWVSQVFFLGQWRRWQRASLHFLAGTRVLEIGMGTGNLHLDLVRSGYAAWGVDLSPQMLRQASRKARRHGPEALLICRARAQALPFPAGSFDSVVSTFPSDYIANPQTLEEIGRVLRAGGRLVVVPAGWLRPKGASGRAADGVARLVYGGQAAAGEEPNSHIQASTWGTTLRERMASAGFEVSLHIASNTRGAALVVLGMRKT